MEERLSNTQLRVRCLQLLIHKRINLLYRFCAGKLRPILLISSWQPRPIKSLSQRTISHPLSLLHDPHLSSCLPSPHCHLSLIHPSSLHRLLRHWIDNVNRTLTSASPSVVAQAVVCNSVIDTAIHTRLDRTIQPLHIDQFIAVSASS
jgi:hypothetical protein